MHPMNKNAIVVPHTCYGLHLHHVEHNNYHCMMDDMFLYRASNFFERCLSCANAHVHIHIMMDDVYIYHAHTSFGLCLFFVGTHEYLSTSQSHELKKRALESNGDLGFRGFSFPPLPSRNDFTHLFYMALTWLWVIYHFSLYAHITMFTLHDMLIPMPLPCICDPCFALHMMIDSSTCMCICMLGGDIACCCHVPLVDSSSMLHLRATSLHDMTHMLAYVASLMIHTCSIHAVDGIHFHTLHMIAITFCHMSPHVASLILVTVPSIECN